MLSRSRVAEASYSSFVYSLSRPRSAFKVDLEKKRKSQEYKAKGCAYFVPRLGWQSGDFYRGFIWLTFESVVYFSLVLRSAFPSNSRKKSKVSSRPSTGTFVLRGWPSQRFIVRSKLCVWAWVFHLKVETFFLCSSTSFCLGLFWKKKLRCSKIPQRWIRSGLEILRFFP